MDIYDVCTECGLDRFSDECHCWELPIDMTFSQLEAALGEILPGVQLEEDNYGQIVIYTGLEQDVRGKLRVFENQTEPHPLDDKGMPDARDS